MMRRAATALFAPLVFFAMWGTALAITVLGIPLLHYYFFGERNLLVGEFMSAMLFGRSVGSIMLMPKEQAHLIEVGGIIRSTLLMVLNSYLVLFWYGIRGLLLPLFSSQNIQRWVFSIMISSLAILVGLGTFAFDSFFIYVHTILFHNDWWLLPGDSVLLTLFPPQFVGFLFAVLLTVTVILTILIRVVHTALRKKFTS